MPTACFPSAFFIFAEALMEFFYLDNGQRRGPIDTAQLRALAQQGIITQETVVFCGDRQAKAGRIKGLTFGNPIPAEPEKKTLTERMEAKAAELEEKAAALAATRKGKLTRLGWKVLFGGLFAALAISITAGIIHDQKPEVKAERQKKEAILSAAHAAVRDELGHPDPIYFSDINNTDVLEWESGHVNVSFETSIKVLGRLATKLVTVRLKLDGDKWVPEYPMPVTILDN